MSGKGFLVLAVPLLILLVPMPSHSLEMSSKRDCAICHIMWMDDFRTSKDTLIKWQPGNVLMKDTQGVVSSDDICYSCHDGYVDDSRHIVDKHQQHPVFVGVSQRVTVPAALPLSSKDEIYCGTCHTAHGPGAPPAGELPVPASFFRVRNVDSNLCEMCHKRQVAFKRSRGHPLNVANLQLPGQLFALGSVKAQNPNQIICQTCHQVHGAKGAKNVIVDNKDSELCVICHVQHKSMINTKHDLRMTWPQETNIKQQRPSEAGPCSACHTPHDAAGQKLWAKRLGSGNQASQMCLTCHDRDASYRIQRIGRYSHPNDIASSTTKPMEARLPLFLPDGRKDPAGRLQCFTCHDVHRWNPESDDQRGAKNISGDGSNSFLRIANDRSSALCLTCHTDKRHILASDHNLTITAPDEKNVQGFTAGRSGLCSACHVPHNAAGKRLWAKKLDAEQDFAAQVCTACHRQDGAARLKSVGGNDHPVNVAMKRSEDRGDGGPAIANLPLYGPDGNRKPEAQIVCLTCHEPHVWKADPPQGAGNDRYQNTEGDAASSFLRQANSPASALCKTCHPEKAQVDGSVHDLGVSAPTAVNLAQQTVNASGPCGACHLVHNSPNKIKLWARPFGPAPEDDRAMNGLCTSCHAKGQVAEKKTPPIAIHPPGNLLTNVIRPNSRRPNYMPIFDRNGRPQTVGEISCPSCHDTHRWGSSAKGGAGLQGADDGGVFKFRFLRNMSHDTFCAQCHGADGLFRYLYFHDPQKRKKSL